MRGKQKLIIGAFRDVLWKNAESTVSFSLLEISIRCLKWSSCLAISRR
jgi:hypothetical protein